MSPSTSALPVIADHFKRNLITDTARRLAAEHGRLKMYSADQVRGAVKAAGFPMAWVGWAAAVFCTNAEFADFCTATGLQADYNNTRLDALRFFERPSSGATPSAMTTVAGVAGVAALASGAAFAGNDDEHNERSSALLDSAEVIVDATDLAGSAVEVVGSVASTALDVVGSVFETLDIFG